MSVADYKQSTRIIVDGNTFEAIIMAAMAMNPTDGLTAAFPDIWREWMYRHWSGGALMPGEPGYNPATDDNLPTRAPGAGSAPSPGK